jgi:hypothetical protein
MWVNTGGEEHEAWMFLRDRPSARRGIERLTNADDSARAGRAGTVDHIDAILIERRISEMGVSVDEDGHEKARTADCSAVPRLQNEVTGLRDQRPTTALSARDRRRSSAIARAAPFPSALVGRGHLRSIQRSKAPAT